MRLIDADAYKKYLTENWIPANYNAILAQPTIDAVKVVRCKDCRYNPQRCFIGCPVDVPVDDDFFCAKGKRRTDDNVKKKKESVCPNVVPCPMDGFNSYCPYLGTDKCPYH